MGCGSSQDIVMEKEQNKKAAREQLDILTGSLLSALYTHHAASKWFEITKKRTKTRKQKKFCEDYFVDSDTEEDPKVPLVRITSCSEYSPAKSIEMRKTPVEQLELFTGSLMSALYTYHAATKWYDKWRKAPVKRRNIWLMDDNERGMENTQNMKKTAKEQIDVFAGSLLSALYTYHAAAKWYHGTKKTSKQMKMFSGKSKVKGNEGDYGAYPEGSDEKKTAMENLDVVTRSLLSALYTYHAAMKWSHVSKKSPLQRDAEVAVALVEEKQHKREPSASVTEVTKSAKEQLDVVTGSLLSALHTYHCASTWYDECWNKPPGPDGLPEEAHSYKEIQKDDSAITAELLNESLMRKTAKEQLDVVTGSLLSALYTYHSATEWHENVISNRSGNTEVMGHQMSQGGHEIPAIAGGMNNAFDTKKPEDMEIVTVTLLTTLLTYRAANKWHNRICQATVQLLEELGFGEEAEGVPGGDNASSSENKQDTKTTAEDIDTAISRLLGHLNTKWAMSDETFFFKDKTDQHGGEGEEENSKGEARCNCADHGNAGSDSENEEDEILTMVTEFVDGETEVYSHFQPNS